MLSLAAVLLCGCSAWRTESRAGKSPLREPTASHDSVTLEIYTASFPFGDDELNGELWTEVDEQQIATDVRRSLKHNGFRAGIVTGSVPDPVAHLLDLTDKPAPEPDVWQHVDLLNEPVVQRRAKQLRPGDHMIITPSPTIHPRLPLLSREDGQVTGRFYEKAQGVLRAEVELQSDGRAVLVLTPELHHDDARQAPTYRDGVTIYEVKRPKEVYRQLQMRLVMAPGDMVLLSGLPDRPGSIGHYTFTEETSRGQEQKMVLIRLVRSMPAELFGEEAL